MRMKRQTYIPWGKYPHCRKFNVWWQEAASTYSESQASTTAVELIEERRYIVRAEVAHWHRSVGDHYEEDVEG